MYMKFINFRWNQLIMGRNYALCFIMCKTPTALVLGCTALLQDVVKEPFPQDFDKNNSNSLISVGTSQAAVRLEQGTLPLTPEVSEGSSHF